MIKILLCFLLITSAFADHHIPDDESPGTTPAAVLRVHHKRGNTLYRFDYEHNTEVVNRTDKRYTLGVRYRFFEHLKAGIYYSKRYGQRHDEDWILGPNPPTWIWRDTDSRAENFVGIELIPRMLVEFLPGTWIAEFRTLIERNFFNDNNTVKLRPGLTHIYMGKSGPLFNLFFQYEAYIPLNYGRETLYEQWLYLGALYHWSKIFKPGVFFTMYEKKWSSTDAFFMKKGEHFTNTEKGNMVGVSLNFTIP
jgi:hypothetical protein